MLPRFVQGQRLGVKICGLTDLASAVATAETGADALGFNFWPKSKRYLPPSAFCEWAGDLPTGVERVGVFVNAAPELVFDLLEGGAIDVAQFHGDESPQYCERFAGRFPYVRALGVRSPESLDRATRFGTRAVLLDAYCPLEYGGSGESFDWELGRRFVSENPEFRVVLAGGLTPENVRRAVAGVRPAAVDVASGVESAPGVKDLDAVRRFVERARG